MKWFKIVISATLVIVAATCAGMQSLRTETYFIFEYDVPFGPPIPVEVEKFCPEIGYGCDYFVGAWRYQLYTTNDGVIFWPVTTEFRR